MLKLENIIVVVATTICVGLLSLVFGWCLHAPPVMEHDVAPTPWERAEQIIQAPIAGKQYQPFPKWHQVVEDVTHTYGVRIVEEPYVSNTINTFTCVITLDSEMEVQDKVATLYHEVGHLYAYGLTQQDRELSAWVFAKREFQRRGWDWNPERPLISLGSYYGK